MLYDATHYAVLAPPFCHSLRHISAHSLQYLVVSYSHTRMWDQLL